MTEIPSDQHITYQLQYRKCGKASCSTCRNTQGHGPYWYAYWREGSRLKSGYVGKTNPKPDDMKLHVKQQKLYARASTAIRSTDTGATVLVEEAVHTAVLV